MEINSSVSIEDSFRECLREHEAIIWKVVYSFSNDSVSHEELYQEILLAIWRALPSFRRDSKLSTWMYSVAFRTAMGLSRKKARKQEIEVPLDAFGNDLASANTAALQNSEDLLQEEIKSLYYAIRQLKEIDRSITLMHLDGLGYQEIGGALGITESNVGARLTRIRKKLAELLKENEQ